MAAQEGAGSPIRAVVEVVARALVDRPDAVRVTETERRGMTIVELTPAQERVLLRRHYELPFIRVGEATVVELQWRIGPRHFALPFDIDHLQRPLAAQLGSMKLAEEIDAMRTIGVSPMEALVLPRVLSTVLMMPLLSFYSAIIAMIGGGIFCWISLEMPPITFIQRVREILPLTDIWQLLVKAPTFGLIVGVILGRR